jgi:hypothetical protein
VGLVSLSDSLQEFGLCEYLAPGPDPVVAGPDKCSTRLAIDLSGSAIVSLMCLVRLLSVSQRGPVARVTLPFSLVVLPHFAG